MNNQKYVTFFLNEGEYGILSDYIQEVLRKPGHIIEYPNMPFYMTGTMMNRGRMIPIINLKKRYQLKEYADVMEKKIIVVQVENNTIALMVDEVDDIIELGENEIQPLGEFYGRNGIHSVQSVGKIEDRIICLIHVMDLIKDMSGNKIEEV